MSYRPSFSISCLHTFFCFVLLVVNGCGDEDAIATDDVVTTSDGHDNTGNTDTSGMRTLTSCDTSIEDGAPAFYQTYFRCVTITMDGDTVVIHTEDLPPHQSFYYPSDDPNFIAYAATTAESFRVPGNLAAQDITVRIPASPTSRGLSINAALVDGRPNSSNQEYKMGPAGVALDSVALFNSLARPGDDIEDELYSFDAYDAHHANSTYHYHTTTPGPLELLKELGLTESTTPGQADVEVYGIMCDGSLVLGCTELDGSSPNESGFDAQNGHVHDITDKGGETHFTDRYHTHICAGETPFQGHRFTPEIQFYDDCSVQ